METCLKPTSVLMWNYSGDRLQVVQQIQVTMSRADYLMTALIQVQRGAPAGLFIGTDLLSIPFVQASQAGNGMIMIC